MKIRTLALGSAAAVMIAGSAQAADLEPFVDDFDYVRICDAFGTGYWYAPGTDTCLRIDGYVRFQVNIFEDGAHPAAPAFYDDAVHDFVSRAQVGITAQSLTEFGPLFARIVMVAQTDRAPGNTGATAGAFFGIDHAYLSIGPLLAGYTGSLFDTPGTYGFSTPVGRPNYNISQARLSYAVAGFGFHASVEDYYNRWGAASPATGEMPDLVAALTGALGPIDFKVAGSVADTVAYGIVWGVRGYAEIVLAPAFRVRAGASYSEDGYAYVHTADTGAGTYWSVWGAARLDVAPNIYLVGSGGFVDHPAGDVWQARFSAHYTPVNNLDVGAEVTYTDPGGGGDTISGLLRLQRNFP